MSSSPIMIKIKEGWLQEKLNTDTSVNYQPIHNNVQPSNWFKSYFVLLSINRVNRYTTYELWQYDTKNGKLIESFPLQNLQIKPVINNDDDSRNNSPTTARSRLSFKSLISPLLSKKKSVNSDFDLMYDDSQDSSRSSNTIPHKMTITLRCDDQKSRDEWVQAIQALIDSLHRVLSTATKQLNNNRRSSATSEYSLSVPSSSSPSSSSSSSSISQSHLIPQTLQIHVQPSTSNEPSTSLPLPPQSPITPTRSRSPSRTHSQSRGRSRSRSFTDSIAYSEYGGTEESHYMTGIDGYDPALEDYEDAYLLGEEMAQNSKACGPGLFGAQAGEAGHFSFQLVDLSDTPVTQYSYPQYYYNDDDDDDRKKKRFPVTATLGNTDCLYFIELRVNPETGVYSGHYTVITPGAYQLEIKLNDEHHICQSPFTVNVTSAWTSIKHCRISFDNHHLAKDWLLLKNSSPNNTNSKDSSGSSNHNSNSSNNNSSIMYIKPHIKSYFTITAYDCYGNRKTTGNDMFEVDMSGTAELIHIQDHNNGIYTVEFIAANPYDQNHHHHHHHTNSLIDLAASSSGGVGDVSGVWYNTSSLLIHVTLRGRDVCNSPFKCIIMEPGDDDDDDNNNDVYNHNVLPPTSDSLYTNEQSVSPSSSSSSRMLNMMEAVSESSSKLASLLHSSAAVSRRDTMISSSLKNDRTNDDDDDDGTAVNALVMDPPATTTTASATIVGDTLPSLSRRNSVSAGSGVSVSRRNSIDGNQVYGTRDRRMSGIGTGESVTGINDIISSSSSSHARRQSFNQTYINNNSSNHNTLFTSSSSSSSSSSNIMDNVAPPPLSTTAICFQRLSAFKNDFMTDDNKEDAASDRMKIKLNAATARTALVRLSEARVKAYQAKNILPPHCHHHSQSLMSPYHHHHHHRQDGSNRRMMIYPPPPPPSSSSSAINTINTLTL